MKLINRLQTKVIIPIVCLFILLMYVQAWHLNENANFYDSVFVGMSSFWYCMNFMRIHNGKFLPPNTVGLCMMPATVADSITEDPNGKFLKLNSICLRYEPAGSVGSSYSCTERLRRHWAYSLSRIVFISLSVIIHCKPYSILVFLFIYFTLLYFTI